MEEHGGRACSAPMTLEAAELRSVQQHTASDSLLSSGYHDASVGAATLFALHCHHKASGRVCYPIKPGCGQNSTALTVQQCVLESLEDRPSPWGRATAPYVCPLVEIQFIDGKHTQGHMGGLMCSGHPWVLLIGQHILSTIASNWPLQPCPGQTAAPR